MLAATLLAAVAVMPLGLWPTQTGSAAVTVRDVEFYLVEPEDDYSILAVQTLAGELQRLAVLAAKLGADAVLLLGEMSERAIPKDLKAPLLTSGRFSVAVFLAFDQAAGWEGRPAVPSASHRRSPGAHRHARPPAAARLSAGFH